MALGLRGVQMERAKLKWTSTDVGADMAAPASSVMSAQSANSSDVQTRLGHSNTALVDASVTLPNGMTQTYPDWLSAQP